MTSSMPAPPAIVRPLPDLPAWIRCFLEADIPVLRETVESIKALRANEDATDANSIGEMIGGDPLMTLKILIHASAHRGRRVETGAETIIAALVMMGIPPFFHAFADQPVVEDRLGGDAPALAGIGRVLRRAHRGARLRARLRHPPHGPERRHHPRGSVAARVRRDCCSGATRPRWPCRSRRSSAMM